MTKSQALEIIAGAAKHLVAAEGTSFEAVAKRDLTYLLEMFLPIITAEEN